MPAFDPILAYRAYIDCLNRQDWAVLGRYVGEACSIMAGLWAFRAIRPCWKMISAPSPI